MIRAITVVCVFFIVCTLSGQSPCELYGKHINKLESIAEHRHDSVLTLLAGHGYWGEWYDLLFEVSGLKEKRSFEEEIRYLNEQKATADKADPYVRGQFYYLLAYVHKMNGDLFYAIEELHSAYSAFHEINDTEYIIRCYRSYSFFYSLFNDHHSAIKFGNLYLRNLNVSDTVNRRIAHENLAEYYYYANNFNEALAHNEKAIGLSDIKSPYSTIAEIKIKLALEKYDEVNLLLETAEQLDEEEWFNQSLRLLKAQYYHELKNYNKSIQILRIILANDVEIEGREKMKIWQALALSYFKNGQLLKALKATHKLQDYFSVSFDNQNIFSIPDSSQLVPEAWLMESLYLKARILESLSRTSDSADEILNTYEKAMYVLDLLRHKFAAVGSVYAISQADFKIFESAIAYCYSKYADGYEDKYFEKAFHYSQTSKAFVSKKARLYREVFAELGVRQALAGKYMHFLAKSHDRSGEIVHVHDSIKLYLNKIIAEYPDFKLINEITTIGTVDVQRKLANSEAVLHYFESDSFLYCLTITNDQRCWKRTALPEEFEATVDEYVRSVSDADFVLTHPTEAEKRFFEFGYKVHNVLFDSNKHFLQSNHIEHLVIEPHGFIHRISFSALPLVEKGDWINPNCLLLDNYTFNYLYYSTEIRERRFDLKDTVRVGYVYGFSYDGWSNNKTSYLGSLKDTREEAKDVHKIIPSTLKIDGSVRRDDFLNNLATLDLLHYSGHAVYDPNNYTKSYLPLTQTPEDSGRVAYSDITSLQNDLKLICLSACNTTNGERIVTEGLISLSRAFIESGSKSCLSSLWYASDMSSRHIVTKFYNALKSGYNKSSSLKEAQISYLTNTEISSGHKTPLYWANWKLYGDPCSLEFIEKNSLRFGWLLIPFVLLALSIYYFFLKNDTGLSRN